MGFLRLEHINPAAPNRLRVLVQLDKGGANWYLRVRVNGRYRSKSLKTPDLSEARRIATHNPPSVGASSSLSVRQALNAFLECKQKLLDSPLPAHEDEPSPIRFNTFSTYRTRVNLLLRYFRFLSDTVYSGKSIPLDSIGLKELNGYTSWRQRTSSGKKLASATMRHEVIQINAIWKWFYEQDYLKSALSIDLKKYRKSMYKSGARRVNRLMTPYERSKIAEVLEKQSLSLNPDTAYSWKLFKLWLSWLEDTFTRPHESRMLRFSDIKVISEGVNHKSVSFYTDPSTKTGRRFVYATSNVCGELIQFYRSEGKLVSKEDFLFSLRSGNAPSASWFSEKWLDLMKLCQFQLQPRELTMYSLRHQGINTLLNQGVAPVKVAELAGHSLQIQQSIYKQLNLDGDKSVLRNPSKTRHRPKDVELDEFIHQAFPWEYDDDGNPDF